MRVVDDFGLMVVGAEGNLNPIQRRRSVFVFLFSQPFLEPFPALVAVIGFRPTLF